MKDHVNSEVVIREVQIHALKALAYFAIPCVVCEGLQVILVVWHQMCHVTSYELMQSRPWYTYITCHYDITLTCPRWVITNLNLLSIILHTSGSQNKAKPCHDLSLIFSAWGLWNIWVASFLFVSILNISILKFMIMYYEYLSALESLLSAEQSQPVL